ncbi:MAG: hypothetical protein OXH59_06690 [Rhodospirillaceae bacterium]|nr:hypothetical protein [Rhodospirillaceae bacterium]
MGPEGVVDLEIVGLVAGDVEHRLVAREIEILLGGGNADALAALAVQVAPIAAVGSVAYDHRMAFRDDRAVRIAHRDAQQAGPVDRQSVEHDRAVAGLVAVALRQAVDRHRRLEEEIALGQRRRVAPGVLGLEAEAEGLARPAQGREDGAPDRRRAGHDGDARRIDDRREMAGGADVGQHLELEAAFHEGLHLHARRPARGVAEDDRNGVALAQIAAANPGGERPPARPGGDAEAGIVELDARLAVGPRRDVAGRGRIVDLETTEIGHRPERHPDRADIVEPVAADGVGQREGLRRAHRHRVRGLQLRMAEQHRVRAGLDRRPGLAHQMFRHRPVERVGAHASSPPSSGRPCGTLRRFARDSSVLPPRRTDSTPG